MSTPPSPCRINPDVEDILKHIDDLRSRRLTRDVSKKIASLEFKVIALSSPVYRLPMECLCEIFLQAARLDPLMPVKVCQVSKTWRRVALNYAPMWAIVRIYTKKKSDGQLRYWLEKSGQSTLDVEMIVHDTVEDGCHTLVQQNIDRCRRLLFWNMSPERVDLIKAWPPRLRHVDLTGFQVDSMDTVLSLLKGTPELRVFALRYLHIHQNQTSRGDYRTRNYPSSYDHEIVSLPHLHELVVPQWSPDFLNFLIPRIHTPKLVTLDIQAHACDPNSSAILNLQPTPGSWSGVRVLRTRGCAFLDNVMMEFLALVPNVEFLYLRNVWITDNFLFSLTHPNPEGGWHAPKLRSLQLHTIHQIGADALKGLIDVRAPTKDSLPLTVRKYLEGISVINCQKVGPELQAWLKARSDRFEYRISAHGGKWTGQSSLPQIASSVPNHPPAHAMTMMLD